MVLCLTGAIFRHYFAGRQRTESQKPQERSRNNLVLRDGRLFDGQTPFSGLVVETYDGGEVKSRSTVANGLLQGPSEGWYTNGVLQVTEYFTNGVSNGLRTKYYPDGHKLSSARIVDGKIGGLYERWHENGKLAEEVHLINGVADGESFAYRPDGSLSARVRLAHGKVVEQTFLEPGEMR